MTEAEFWELIDKKVERDGAELDVAPLEEELLGSRPERIAGFAEQLYRLHDLSYRTRLWGAAYLINGGCSDDGFDYFRAWLIGMGRDIFFAALKDPDSLAAVAEEDVECADLLSVAHDAYQEVTGSEFDLPPSTPANNEPEDDWDFDDDEEMRRRYPRLFAKFG
jgi:hypothetical protein